jgi:hypothetical protein
MKYIRWVALLTTPALITACATNELGEPTGNGAMAIPLTLNLVNTQQHPCKYIGFDFNGSFKRGYLSNVTETDTDQFVGYVLIDDIKPGNYNFEKIGCYARDGRVFNGGKKLIYFPTSQSVTIGVNQVTVTNFRFSGYNHKDLIEKSSTFDLKAETAAVMEQSDTYNDINKNALKAGWAMRTL